jgi:hypothetical protein
MRANWKGLLIMMIVLWLSACAPDPRREAAAYATKVQADQSALHQAQMRVQSEDLHGFEIQRKALAVQHQEAIAANWEAGWNKVIKTATFFAQIAFSLSILGFGIGLTYASIGTGKAWSDFVQTRANVQGLLVHMDYKTRQFPLLPVMTGKNVAAFSDPNTGQVRLLDVNTEGDKIAMLYAGLTRHDAALAYEARHASKSTSEGVTALVSPIIEMEGEA